MTPKEFRACYLAFVELYGVIHSDDAYIIMNKYFPALLKSEMYKDMKSRYDKLTKGYQVIKTTDNKYVIARDIYDYDDLDRIFKEQGDKEFYIPDTYNDLVKYLDKDYLDNEHKDIKDELLRFLSKRTPHVEMLLELIVDEIKLGNIDINHIFHLLEVFDYHITDSGDLDKFMKLYTKLQNNYHNILNRGYSPLELRKKHSVNVNNISLSIGPHMKEMFYNEEMNPMEYYESLTSGDLPDSVKVSMGQELLDIIKRNKNNKA